MKSCYYQTAARMITEALAVTVNEKPPKRPPSAEWKNVASSPSEVLQRSKAEYAKVARILTNTPTNAEVKNMPEETHCLRIQIYVAKQEGKAKKC